MQRQCPVCSRTDESDQVAFSECPECIRNRFQAPGAILPRHTLSGVQAQTSGRPKSYAALDGDKILGYCQMSLMGNFQAAGFSLIPSMNLVPRTTSASSGDPFNDRQPFDALSISLKTIVRHAVRVPLPLVLS